MYLPFNVSLRHKDSREAADTGLLIWRDSFAYFILFFAIPFWVCAFAMRLIPENFRYISWISLWLLKPLFDRLILHVISIRFFEAGAGYKRLLKGLGGTLGRGLLGDLLWRRFSPLRSAMMPVRVLETQGKTGRVSSKRKSLLKDGGLNYCFLLTVWGVCLEAALLFGEMIFFYSIINIFSVDYYTTTGLFDFPEIFIFTAWCFNYMLVETIYVCMGFSLYINSRINVEGWDIEIIFRSFAEKLKNKKLAGMLAVFCLFLFFIPVNTRAEDFPKENFPKEKAPLETLEKILASPEFGGEKDSWGIRLRKQPEEDSFADYEINPFMEKLRNFFSSGLRLILFLLICALAVFLFIFVRKSINERKTDAKDSMLKILNGIPLKNPEELLEKATAFFENNNLRMAWGYCTAAAILSWSLYRGTVFPPNATENDCAQMAEQTGAGNPDEVNSFRSLINYWINFAYADRIPPEGSFEQAAGFCKSLRRIPSNG